MPSIRRFLFLALAVPVLVAVASSAGAATITVNSAADDVDSVDGECTFREAIASANADAASGAATGECAAGSPSPTRDLIRFAIPGTGVKTIALTAPLPAFTAPFHVDGYTQTGAAKNTETAFGITNAQLTVEINGAGIGAEVAGLVIEAGASGVDTPSILEGLVINRVNHAGGCCLDDGILVQSGVHDLVIRGNFIGVQANGLPMVGFSNGGNAIRLALQTAPPGIENGITIGGADVADRNILSASSLGGVSVSGGRVVTIRGNLIGTGRNGSQVSGTAAGITLRDGTTQTSITENLVSGNTIGIHLRGANGNSVTQNRIGTRADGVTPIGNGRGVVIEDVGGTTTTNVFVGNLVAFSTNAGITVRRSSNDVHGNLFVQNSIHGNSGLGIDLGDDGVTANDGAPDADSGPNGLQNFPVLMPPTADGTQIEVDWTLTSAPNLLHQVEFYHSPACDASGHGEGMTYLGQSSGNTNASGVLTSGAVLPSTETTGYVTAIASVLSGTQANSTSEFSACVALPASAPPPPPPPPGTLQLASDVFGGTEGGLVSIGVTRTGGSAGAATATCELVAGTADAADYSLVVGNVSWLDGETDPKECTVQLQTDGVAEGAETFTVVLGNVTGATSGTPVEATVTIQDAAVAPPPAVEVPTLGQWSLLLLALGLALLGLRRLRLA